MQGDSRKMSTETNKKRGRPVGSKNGVNKPVRHRTRKAQVPTIHNPSYQMGFKDGVRVARLYNENV